MTENERKTMMMLADTIQGEIKRMSVTNNLADTIQGEIKRMSVTNNLAEFDTMYGHAKRNIEKLSKMIYDSRLKAESEDKE